MNARSTEVLAGETDSGTNREATVNGIPRPTGTNESTSSSTEK